MNQLEKTDIQLGYIPLLDSVALLWAQHCNYFKEEGLNVTLVKEASWASLRDRLAYGILDTAHCLSAMLPSAALAEDQIGIPLQTSLVLSTNRAYISLSQKRCYELAISPLDTPESSAQKVVQSIHKGHPIHLAHVFKQSIHHYCLRNWLALSDQNVAQTIRLVSLPPPFMVEAIATKTIDGFCVGEPWNTQAQIDGYSQIILASHQIIPNIADKVLATTQEWAKLHPKTLNALLTAIQRAQYDLTHLENLDKIWELLKMMNIIRFECSDHRHVQAYHNIQEIIRSFGTQQRPKTEHFIWILKQMNRWDDLNLDSETINSVAESCII